MAIGVSYDDFWYNDPNIAKTMLKAHEIRQKMDNERYWLQGLYTYIALCNVSPILHAFAKKGTKPLDYPSKPLSFDNDKDEQENGRKKRLKKLREEMIALSKSKKGG